MRHILGSPEPDLQTMCCTIIGMSHPYIPLVPQSHKVTWEGVIPPVCTTEIILRPRKIPDERCFSDFSEKWIIASIILWSPRGHHVVAT